MLRRERAGPAEAPQSPKYKGKERPLDPKIPRPTWCSDSDGTFVLWRIPLAFHHMQIHIRNNGL